ncbi:hypothetical protein [Dolichospermum sp. UHCC 0259]|uniref:hypothetical protein n=1 Tax=Dolichospermum sp. UHCC 0259 TaxID=2590010 RepID=UPI00144592A0|nr:hypothetical protein [Dolichospermum sp. UHCC 0259]MTJ46548.1 hypothetical protein [Dolichospermum sp. UHCC 0259]
MSGIPIYQFCRGFDNVRYSEVYQCYVSGGYAFEKIACWNREVPQEIREAVIKDDFKLNDNYPPEDNDFALIAREIDNKYSVLAVANRQLDDGGRPTIGYKYFWLEKSSPDVDGIGTLIYWWSNHKEPKFDMSELVETSLPEIFYYALEYQKTKFQESWLQETWKTVENLSEIPHTVVVTKELWQQQYPEYIKLHYLALGLSLRANHTNSPNAWAWNVQKLAHPDSFISIFYATQEDRLSNIRNIRKRNLPALNLVSPQTHTPDDPTPDKAQQESPTPLPSKTSNSIPSAVRENIKSCLSSLANTFNQNGLNPKKTQELFGYLRDYADADWTNCRDKNTLNHASSPYDIYPQLIYLVAPNNKSSENWLLKMVQSLELDTQQTSSGWISTLRNWANPSESNRQSDISEFQRVLLEAIYDLEASYDQGNSVIYKLESSIYFGISFLLDKLINPDRMININEVKVMAQKIDYLLTRSQGIWQTYFKEYTEIIAQVILYQENINYPSVITFCQPILDIIPNLKNIHEQNRRYQYGNYKSLAIIFSKTHRKDLAEFFYRMSGTSGDKIPTDVRTSLDPQIRSRIFYVPNQTGMYSNSSNNSDSNSEGDPSIEEGDRAANAVIVGVFFFIVVLIFFYMAKGFYPKETQPSDNIDESESTICEQSNVNFLGNFKNYKECYLEENKEIPAQELEKFIPKGSPIESKKQHLEQLKNYFRNIEDEDTFNNKIKQLSKCKNKPSLDFDKCLNPDIFDLTRQEILKKLPQPLKNNLEHLLKKDKKKSKG